MNDTAGQPPDEQPLPPPPVVPAPPSPGGVLPGYPGDRWQYKWLEISRSGQQFQNLEAQLNAFGANGYEAVGLTSWERSGLSGELLHILLKRKVVPGDHQ